MSLIEKVVKEEIKKLKRIKDTAEDRFDFLRLDKNERITPFAEDDLAAFRNGITSADISGYAELDPLYRKLAKYLGVEVNQLFMASGSDLAIKSIYEACIGKEDKVIVHRPSYAMCRVYAWMFGAEVVAIPMKDDWTIDFDGMLASVDDKTKLMVIENPNGSVGTSPNFDQIKACAKALQKKNVLLLIDEAYYFISHSALETVKLIATYPNVIVSQTFSKGHGLAGTRFGYLVGDQKIIEYISRVRPMHEVTSLTAKAADWILDNPAILEQYQKEMAASRNFLVEELTKMGIECRNSEANFVLIYFPDEGVTKGLPLKLRDKKILVRRPFEEAALKGWCRITVGTRQDCGQFIDALKNILAETE